MTRVNLVKAKNLSDQHLLTEWRELPRIPTMLHKRLAKKDFEQQLESFCLGTGHMVFFYDKMKFLSKRHKEIIKELKIRKFKIKVYETDPFLATPKEFHNDWCPNAEEVNISYKRIAEKIKQRAGWYRYYGLIRSTKFFLEIMK